MSVSGTEVVRLLESLEQDAPVHVSVEGPRSEEVVLAEVEAAEVLLEWREPGIDIDGFVARGGNHPDQAEMLKDGKFDEADARTVNRVEAHGLRQPSEDPFEVVGPGVIRAGEATGVAAWFALEGGASMPAHVEKRLQVAVLGAGDEDRHTGLAMREEIPWIRQLGAMRNGDRELTEQHLDLSLEVIGIGVLRHRVLHHIIEHLGGAVFVEVEDPTDDLALVLGGTHRRGP